MQGLESLAMQHREPFAGKYDKLVKDIDVDHGLWTELQTTRLLRYCYLPYGGVR